MRFGMASNTAQTFGTFVFVLLQVFSICLGSRIQAYQLQARRLCGVSHFYEIEVKGYQKYCCKCRKPLKWKADCQFGQPESTVCECPQSDKVIIQTEPIETAIADLAVAHEKSTNSTTAKRNEEEKQRESEKNDNKTSDVLDFSEVNENPSNSSISCMREPVAQPEQVRNETQSTGNTFTFPLYYWPCFLGIAVIGNLLAQGIWHSLPIIKQRIMRYWRMKSASVEELELTTSRTDLVSEQALEGVKIEDPSQPGSRPLLRKSKSRTKHK